MIAGRRRARVAAQPRRVGRRRRPGWGRERGGTSPPSARRAEVAGATALKAEPEQKLSPTEQLEAQLPLAAQTPDAKATAAARRAEAKAKGYEGEMCGGVPELHAGAQRHVPEVRHVRVNDGV